MFNKIIADGIIVYANIIVDDREYDAPPVLMSVSGYSNSITKFAKQIVHPCTLGVTKKSRGYRQYSLKANVYDLLIHKEDSLGHAVVFKKDEVYTRSGHERLRAYVYTKNELPGFNTNTIRQFGEEFFDESIIPSMPEELLDKVFDKLQKNTPVPLLRKWMNYILYSLIRRRDFNELSLTKYPDCQLRAFKLDIEFQYLFNIVSAGLRDNRISLKGQREPSRKIQEVTGMDSYLNAFKEVLAEKIQSSFTPRFNPCTDSYSRKLKVFDLYNKTQGLELYEAQKAVIEAVDRALKEQDVSFVCGEMGVGKTPIALGIVYCNHNKPGGTTVVLCPGHLVHKWEAEIKQWMPSSESAIVTSFKDVCAIESKVKDRNRKKHLFLIISKDRAKNSYKTRPAAVWSNVHDTFLCPSCGKRLFSIEKERVVYFDKLSMTKELAKNKICPNTVRTWNPTLGKFIDTPCNAPLWVPNTPNQKEWVKLRGDNGWVHNSHVHSLCEEYTEKSKSGSLNRREASMLSALSDAVEGDTVNIAPRTYTPSKYIKKYFKGYIDYLIADELHQYKSGSSLQGKAFDDLVSVAKKTICLTGTMLNGYAEGIFYILYRCFPYIMKREGFDFRNYNAFNRTYGVVQRTEHYDFEYNRRGRRLENGGGEKTLPGVSPLVFTRFLMETTAFITLDDIANGLPDYTEIPVAVAMDDELRQAYSNLEQNLRREIARSGVKLMSSMLQTLSAYPDMPYRQPTVTSDSGAVLVTPVDLPVILRNKENEYLQIVDRAIANGEKVLTYYDLTKKTNLGTRLPELLNQRGYKTAVLYADTVKSADREAWIKKKVEKENIDVLICNPNLVETGLDLIDFTTIVFYQVGYNLFTMRQASRRSLRLTQTRPVNVYFMYYQGTIQEQALSLMATKLMAASAIEGKFSEEGLHAMSNSEDLLTAIANSIVQGIKHTVDVNIFSKVRINADTDERTADYSLHELAEMASIKEPIELLVDRESRNRFFLNLQDRQRRIV